MKSGAFLALSGMLTTLLGLFIALRYWFLASRWLAERQALPLPFLAASAFWAIFIVAIFILIKVRQRCTDAYESVLPSLVDRLLGAAFGLVSGMAVMTAVMLTLSITSPAFWPAYNHDQLPLPMDRWPLETYRLIETRFAHMDPAKEGHTLLPSLNDKSADKPVDFWK